MILPDATLGILGGGQLGRMFTLTAYGMGYRVVVLDPDPHSPAGQIADQHIKADYRDHAALQILGEECAAVTTEFENVPADSLEYLQQFCTVRPGPGSVRIAQDRIREKTFIRDHELSTAPFAAIYEAADLEDAFATLQPPLLLKTASLGYDGKGQIAVNSLEEALAAFDQLGNRPCVLEERLDLAREISVVLARCNDGRQAVYPVGENRHINGILDTTLVPASIDEASRDMAVSLAGRLADAMDYCGVLAVEFFITRQGELLINELAGSGGDYFPWVFRQQNAGPLIGTRTWGGLVKSSVHYPMIDGGALTAPDNAVFDPIKNQWIGENVGIPPDIEVIQDARSVAEGRDPQLERGVEELLRMLATEEPREITPPPFPTPAGK